MGAALGVLGESAVRSNPMAGVDEAASPAGVDVAVPVSAGVVAGLDVSLEALASESESDSSSWDWAPEGFFPRAGLRVGYFFFFLADWERSSPSKL